MALPPSKLTEVIEGLAEDFSMKARAIPAMLKKQGVKDEELKFANLGLPNPTENSAMEAWSKDQLKAADAARTDKQGVIVHKGKGDTDYGSVNVQNPTNDYEERIYTFGIPPKEGGEALFRSEHFPADTQNYLAHTRIQPMDINGKKTRTILELQSDLHASNRKAETVTSDAIASIDEDIAKVNSDNESLINYYGSKEKALSALEEQKQLVANQGNASLVNAPYQDSVTRKLIEREIFNAVDEGALHSAIPLAGPGTNKLQRSPEIQAMYSEQVKNTAIKIAKQQGLNYSVEKAGAAANKDQIANVDNLLTMLDTAYGPVDAARRAYRANPSREAAKELSTLDSGMTLTRYGAVLNSITSELGDQELKTAASMLTAGKLSLQEFKDKVAESVAKPRPSKEVEYLVIDHPKGTKLNMNLYAAPAATASAAYLAYKAGYGEEEVSTYLVEKEGYSEEEAKSMAAQTKQAIDAGYSQEEVVKHFESKEVTTPQQDVVTKPPAPATAISKPISSDEAAAMTHKSATIDSSYYDRVFKATTTSAQNAKELVASQEVLRPAMVSTMQQTKAFAGYDNQTNELVAQKTNEQRQHIIDFAKQKGVELEYDPNTVGWRVMTENGWQEANPSMWSYIKKSKGEIAGYIAGATIGSRAGKIAGIALFPEVAPLSGSAGFVLGGLIGGAGGAVVGTDLDYIYEAMTHNAEMDAAVQQQRELNAAQASVLYDVIGGLALKTPSAVKSLTQAVKSVPAKLGEKLNPANSVDNALANTMFVNKDEANDLVRIMERFADVPGKTDVDKRVAASIYSLPGSEGIASAVARVDPLASRAIARTIDLRAQDVLKASENLTDENLTKLVQQDLKNYEDDVKNFYTTVKSVASETPNAANYKFNIDKLAIDPVLDSLKKNIDDPRVMEKFLLQVNRIQQFSKSRDFNDLLELRKTVNNFKYNTKITNAKDFNRVDEVVKNIDAAITEGAGKVIPSSDEWLASFKQANFQYAQMMNIKKNVLYKSLIKPGQDYDRTVSALTRYITAEDSTFMDVVAKLPNHTKAKVEGSVINSLTEKYTAGVAGGERAVYFPQLSQELAKLPLTTPEARKFSSALQEMAEVFRNDVPLASVTGSLRPPSDTAILTSDLLAATKRSFASKIFNYAKRSIGSDSSKLIYKAAEVLENPLNTKSMKELMESIDGKINIDAEAKALLNATAKEQSEKGFVGAPKVIFYGDGNILSSKAGNGTKQTIALHRIATIEQATKIAESEGINPADTKLLDAALSALGYKAVQQGADKVRVLK